MPNYDFSCTKCGHTFERVVSIQQTILHCPKCNEPAHREFPTPNFIMHNAFQMTYDPIQGRELTKDEQRDYKKDFWPQGSEYAKKHNLPRAKYLPPQE